MLVLSILIILALAVAVASFFVASAQWLLFISAGLVLLAFYLSRRASHGIGEPASSERSPAPRKLREHLTVHEELPPREIGRPHDGDTDSHHDNGRAVAS
jgi:hypothetical protein